MIPQIQGISLAVLPAASLLSLVLSSYECSVLGIGLWKGDSAKLSTGCLFLIWQLLEIQAQYHRQSLESLDSALTELKESHSQKGTQSLAR